MDHSIISSIAWDGLEKPLPTLNLLVHWISGRWNEPQALVWEWHLESVACTCPEGSWRSRTASATSVKTWSNSSSWTSQRTPLPRPLALSSQVTRWPVGLIKDQRELLCWGLDMNRRPGGQTAAPQTEHSPDSLLSCSWGDCQPSSLLRQTRIIRF